MSEIYEKVVAKQLDQKSLKGKTKIATCELIKYWLIAQHKDAELAEHYKSIQNYFTTVSSENFIKYDYMQFFK